MNKELLPCPFCGEQVKIEDDVGGQWFGLYYIGHYCTKIGVEVNINMSDYNIDLLTEAWNHRISSIYAI